MLKSPRKGHVLLLSTGLFKVIKDTGTGTTLQYQTWRENDMPRFLMGISIALEHEQPSIAMFDYQVHTMILIGIGGNKPVHQMGYPAWGAYELVFFKFGPSLLPSDVAQNHLCPATVSSRHFFIPMSTVRGDSTRLQLMRLWYAVVPCLYKEIPQYWWGFGDLSKTKCCQKDTIYNCQEQLRADKITMIQVIQPSHGDMNLNG